MVALPELTARLSAQQDLSPEEVQAAAAILSTPGETDEAKAAFLAAFATKGETPAEIAVFAKAFRVLAINPGVEAIAPQAIDIVGTGGDHAGSFNISSMVVLLLASAGVPVMKHGNRGITSQTGSADLLAGLGVELAASPEKSKRALEQLGYAFFFAPNYHPAFKHVGPVRKLLAAQGRRSIFNILGPLINPGRPAHILLGVYSLPLVEKLALTLDELGQPAGLVGHGRIDEGRGIDEITTATPNAVRGIGRLREMRGTWGAETFGLSTSAFDDLKGGDLTANLATVEAILDGRAPAGLVDTIVLNAALGLFITGRTKAIPDGIGRARELLLGGAVRAKIAATKEFYRA